jgi:hypothetical protein
VTRNLSTNMVRMVTKAVVQRGQEGLDAGEVMVQGMS